ncbi:hypothetical protein Trydic_g17634 [Trypoxylus dichotomus]
MEDHHSHEGHRPISLLCTISKVFEILLLAGINDHLDEHRLLDKDQFGFRSGHSNTSQLFRITDHVTTAFNRKQTGISGSGENVRQNPPRRTAAEDEELGLPRRTRDWSQRDIPQVQDNRVFNAIYADDTAIVATSRHSKNAAELAQGHLAKIEDFFCAWSFKINSRKMQARAARKDHNRQNED